MKRNVSAFRRKIGTAERKEAQELFSQALRGGTAAFFLEEDLPFYFVSDELLRMLGFTCNEFMAESGGNLLTLIHPDDCGEYMETLHSELGKDGRYDKISRVRMGDGRFHWMRDLGKMIRTEDQRDAVLLLRCDVSDILDHQWELERKAAVYEEKSRQLQALTANIPGGVCEVAVDEFLTLLYGNEGFYKLYGYTAEQLKEEKDNHVMEVIFEMDRGHVRKNIEAAYIDQRQSFEFEHRIVRRDGTIIWALINGNFSYYKGRQLINCVVVNITERKRVEEEARISEKRFRIALAETDNTIYEYDIRTKVMIHGDRSAEYYGLQQKTENVPDSLVENGTVHPDSVAVFLELYERIRTGAATANCIIRARTNDEEYVWRKITMTTIFDENGCPVQAVGFLENIDEQVRREESLRYQSERDSLTGLYNRGGMLCRIGRELECRAEADQGALFIIDIDEFKEVNDHYGHLFGDFVLSESARRISRILPEHSLVSRIGGDEFVAFIHDALSKGTAQTYVQQVLDAFHEKFIHKGITATVSCSVGATVWPQDGQAFEELYQKADLALYRAKRKGRNQMVQYSPEM